MQSQLEKNLRQLLIKSLSTHKLKKDDNLFIASDLSALGKFKLPKKEKLKILFDIIKNDLIPEGTLFVPTASMNLCNKSIVFDLEKTPSNKMGAFSEFVRLKKKSIRSCHPYWSLSGIGPKANILNSVSRHSYGIGSPWSKFLDLNVKQVNIGIHPSRAVTLIHHVETCVGVPYRYTKEFTHKIKKNSKIKTENFYMSVFYKNTDIKKRIKLNQHYFNQLKKNTKLVSSSNNEIRIWSFRMNDFFNTALDYFVTDIYNYLEEPPKLRPYTR